MPDRFACPPFNCYDEKTDPVEHVSHYIQMMSLHTHNDALMCKVFPSSLGPTALRWFNGLRKGPVRSFFKLIQEFGVRFVTCSRVPQPVDALLSMKMRAEETLCSYASRYWELYNEISGDNERVAASTFRMGLPEDSGLRESLTKKPLEGMRQLMRRIEEYKRLEDDRLQSKGKALMMTRPRQAGFPFRPRGGPTIQEPATQMGEVNVTFKEPVHRILDQIKHEPGHTTEQCRVLKDHLEQLVKAGHLKDFVLDSGDRVVGQDIRQRGNPLLPPVGIIEVIHVAPEKLIVGRRKGVLTVVPVEGNPGLQSSGKKMKFAREPVSFNDGDLEGTIQPHDDALMVTARINGFLVKRVMIDQGSGADVMYPDLFKGLGLKKEDLMKHTSPLVGFDGKVVIPEGQISLPVIMGGKEVSVTFTIASSFSLYTAILGRPWIHSMRAVPSTLHVKIKFPTEWGVIVIKGDQQAARQCLTTVVNWKQRN
ncbi:uncharacterized protein LOC126708368 [Quercus robur]|uniref:uncharacterized protein LOC126708368 n=1 Tax=Quercus robur TaxID=38942 RepID=UPI002163CB87|nr:uncharacterized protein LOC126708368 [Quercus robur]